MSKQYILISKIMEIRKAHLSRNLLILSSCFTCLIHFSKKKCQIYLKLKRKLNTQLHFRNNLLCYFFIVKFLLSPVGRCLRNRSHLVRIYLHIVNRNRLGIAVCYPGIQKQREKSMSTSRNCKLLLKSIKDFIAWANILIHKLINT